MRIELGKAAETGAPLVSIRAPAKLNLFLEVLAKRPDGYHEIETLLCPISLCDQVRVELSDRPEIDLEMEILDASASSGRRSAGLQEERPPSESDPAWQIPLDARNLILRAAERTREELGIRQGCRIRLQKRIPAAAGMGGGSSDAAATVVACLQLWDQWDRYLATSVCAELGSDIPFFLGNRQGIGLALATGRGEKIELLQARPHLEFLVTHPPAGCSTSEIYAGYTRLAASRSAEKIVKACQTGQVPKIGAELFNALQSSAFNASLWVERQLKLLTDCGQQFVLVTGSGSSCFAVHDPRPGSPSLAEVAEIVGRRAWQIGIYRVYSVRAWYADSIEDQLQRGGGRPACILRQ